MNHIAGTHYSPQGGGMEEAPQGGSTPREQWGKHRVMLDPIESRVKLILCGDQNRIDAAFARPGSHFDGIAAPTICRDCLRGNIADAH
jgi:hypothetical protein